MENLLIRNILNLGNEEQGLWKTDTCFCFFEDNISVCDLRVTNGCYICLYENVKVGFYIIFQEVAG